jgi:small subunit ribosomal protein S2
VAKVADAVLEGKAMRKEEQPEEPVPTHESRAERAQAQRAPHVVDSDEEVEEGALLGASTLAKLNVTRKPEEPAAPEVKPAEAPEAAPESEPTSTDAPTEEKGE